MKRGLDVEAIHFYSPPFTSERSRQKVIDLAGKLAEIKWKHKSAYQFSDLPEIQLLIQKTNPGKLLNDNNSSFNDAGRRSHP